MSFIKNQKGYLTVESAMVIPIILCVIMVLSVLQYKVSNNGALAVLEDRKTLVEILNKEPKIQLFYKIYLANGIGEISNELKKDEPDEK